MPADLLHWFRITCDVSGKVVSDVCGTDLPEVVKRLRKQGWQIEEKTEMVYLPPEPTNGYVPAVLRRVPQTTYTRFVCPACVLDSST